MTPLRQAGLIEDFRAQSLSFGALQEKVLKVVEIWKKADTFEVDLLNTVARDVKATSSSRSSRPGSQASTSHTGMSSRQKGSYPSSRGATLLFWVETRLRHQVEELQRERSSWLPHATW